MILHRDDEDNVLFVNNSGTSYFSYAPPTPSFRGIDNLTTATQTGIADSIRAGAQATIGIGIIAVGAGILIGTRGAGYKPAAIIMNTGLQYLGDIE